MDAAKQIRVIVVDDHEAVRQCLVLMIEQACDMGVFGVAGDGASAVELAKVIVPDVVVMDVEMPVMDGIKASGRIIALNPAVKILLVSASFSEYVVAEAACLPVAGFVEKARAGKELLEAIRSVHGGGGRYVGKGVEIVETAAALAG